MILKAGLKASFDLVFLVHNSNLTGMKEMVSSLCIHWLKMGQNCAPVRLNVPHCDWQNPTPARCLTARFLVYTPVACGIGVAP